MFFLSGLTLIELCVVIWILVLGCIVAVPAFQFLQDKVQADVEINHLLQLLTYAREAAIERGEDVVLCGGSLPLFCTGEWSSGMLVYVEESGSRQDNVLRVAGKLVRGRFYWSRGIAPIVFTPMGFVKGQNGTFTYCPNSGDRRYLKAVVLSLTGRVRVAEANELDEKLCGFAKPPRTNSRDI